MDFLDTLLTTAEPLLLEAISLLVGAFLAYVANLIRQRTGLEIEARHREALHSAIMTGVATALRDGPGAGRDAIIDQAITYARQSVPDAIKRLRPTAGVLERIADRYAGDALALGGGAQPRGAPS